MEDLNEYKEEIEELLVYMRSIDFYLLDRESQQCYKNMLEGLTLYYQSAKRILEITGEYKQKGN